MALLLALVLALAAPQLGTEQPAAPADTLAPDIDVDPKIVPGSFWSPSKGLGVGGGVELENVTRPGSRLELIAEVMQRYLRLRAAFFTADPFEAGLYGGVRLAYTTTSVRPYYGLGPQTSRRNKVFVSHADLEAEVRLGWHPLGSRGLLVQPVVRLLHDRVRSFRDDKPAAFERLDARSQANLLGTVGEAATGVTYGLELALDGRDRPEYSTRGTMLQLTGRRYDGLDRDPFRYWAGTASLFHFVPLGGRHVLGTRAVLALTRPIGEEPLPFFALPVLDDDLLGAYTSNRFTGNDLVALTAEYRFPVFDLLGWYGLDGAVQIHLANAYDDVFRQFEPGVEFGRELAGEGRRTPLRPALALGGRIVNLDRNRIVLGGVIGVAAEGFTFGTFNFVYGLRDTSPIVR